MSIKLIYSEMATKLLTKNCLLGPDFLVLFFSGSRPLALKSLSKSHQMKTFWEKNDVVLVKTSTFWTKQIVIWWLFDDDLRAREREPILKKNQKIQALNRYFLTKKETKKDLDDYWHGLRTPSPKFLATAQAYFVCQIGPIF